MLIRWFVVSVEQGHVCVRVRARDCPGACAGGVLAVNLGHHRGEVSALAGAWDQDVPGAIEHSIEQQIRDDPARVASPIAIVQIDRDGFRWIRPGVCRP